MDGYSATALHAAVGTAAATARPRPSWPLTANALAEDRTKKPGTPDAMAISAKPIKKAALLAAIREYADSPARP